MVDTMFTIIKVMLYVCMMGGCKHNSYRVKDAHRFLSESRWQGCEEPQHPSILGRTSLGIPSLLFGIRVFINVHICVYIVCIFIWMYTTSAWYFPVILWFNMYYVSINIINLSGTGSDSARWPSDCGAPSHLLGKLGAHCNPTHLAWKAL